MKKYRNLVSRRGKKKTISISETEPSLKNCCGAGSKDLRVSTTISTSTVGAVNLYSLKYVDILR